MSALPVKEVVCALIIKNHSVLLAQRGPSQDRAGKWEFPGGKRKENETPEQALVREIKEELLLDVSVVKSMTVTKYGYNDFIIQLVPFICVIVKGEPVCTEHAAIEWVTPNRIMQFDLVPADIPVALEWTMMQK